MLVGFVLKLQNLTMVLDEGGHLRYSNTRGDYHSSLMPLLSTIIKLPSVCLANVRIIGGHACWRAALLCVGSSLAWGVPRALFFYV